MGILIGTIICLNNKGGGDVKYIPLLFLLLVSCSGVPVQDCKQTDQIPDIFPDYIGITIPYNIAPLNFKLNGTLKEAWAVISFSDIKLEVKARKNEFVIPETSWKKLLQAAKGKEVRIQMQVRDSVGWNKYQPFTIQIANEPVDSYLVYRLIEPGYEMWNRMGIYQRNLETYDESAILENRMTGNNCMNCHSFCMQNPGKMLFHTRQTYPGTILIDGNKIEKLDTKTEQTISSLVYPSWHPSGKYVAFSVNKIKQSFHMNDKNRIEVFDEASDVVVYDVEKHEIITTPKLFSQAAFETFPTFSPDGSTLYYCVAEARPMPRDYKDVKYSLCSIAFDPETRKFGLEVDTLYNAYKEGKSASFPRVSPDGNYLLYTLSGYGSFSIWHKDADLYLIDLKTKENRLLNEVNSEDVESYHSWSSNSRWFVFSSRRIDGLYTRLYIAYMDKDGKVGKPFLLPQRDTEHYNSLMKSYNIPEFVFGKVKVNKFSLALNIKENKSQKIDFTDE